MKKHKKALSLLVLSGIVGGLITNIPDRTNKDNAFLCFFIVNLL